ncbi:MAG TPA: efflux RND transporter permease subunit [Myxococcaceae bacterium]|nr:efflux RND transporter permease subunit [Myxococcaceae bacterium]
MAHKTDSELLKQHNTARYFTENRQLAWVLLVGTLVLGAYGYTKMPKRKDPLIPVRVAVAITPWPGAPAEKVEQLITRKVEEKIASNSQVEKIESTSRNGVSVVFITVREDAKDIDRALALDDIDSKIKQVTDLPEGALPIQFNKDFGDTAALMLTVASPKASEVELALRTAGVERAIRAARASESRGRVSVVMNFPAALNRAPLERVARQLGAFAGEQGVAQDVRLLSGAGFVGFDARSSLDEPQWQVLLQRFAADRLQSDRLHPDLWPAAVIADPDQTAQRLAAVAGDKYSLRQLDDFSDFIAKRLQTSPLVAKVTRAGTLDERVFLDYSQDRFAALGVTQASLQSALAAQNVLAPGGLTRGQGRNLIIAASGEFGSEREIGDVLVGSSHSGAPIYMRDLVDVSRGYEDPPRYLNFHTWRGSDGAWHRSRAITVAVQMRAGQQIADFSADVERTLSGVRQTIPEDLILARTSDQPRQVKEKVELFMLSFYEAIAIIVLIGLIGFWEWRSALLLAFSIPLTLALTYGLMYLLGIDIQQMSIAALIIALGLLVDDPVVAGDAIKRQLDEGRPRLVAAWLGPTRLARAILFATITNIVAYLPFLIMSGDVGRFIFALPVVIACSLVASRVVSMTFVPLLGYVLLRGRAHPLPWKERREKGASGVYARAVRWAIEHRYRVLLASLLVLLAGGLATRQLKTSFFPKDLSYLSYVDIWLPENATLAATEETATLADQVVQEVAEQYGRNHPDRRGRPRDVLQSTTTFLGGGSPRFWFSLSPQQDQLNYAQLVIEVKDNHDTTELLAPLQQALSARVPGALLDVRQLETGKPVGNPVEVRLSGDDIGTLRALSDQVQAILRSVPIADRIRDDWGIESPRLELAVNADRARLAGVSNREVAASSTAAFSGAPLGRLRDRDKQIPIVARLRDEERGTLSSLSNLYVLSTRGPNKVPLRQVSSVGLGFAPEKIQRRNQVRTVVVSSSPVPGRLPSEVMKLARERLAAVEKALPPGYFIEIGGAQEQTVKVFRESAVVAIVSVLGILLALMIQFRSAVKPLIVLAAIPYGGAGALLAIVMMGAPFGFTAVLGIISLIGVIVSHVIVLFDFIEEMHERGEPLEEALVDAGLLRLRPVLITVGATVFGLVPLAVHGGALWEPLTYAQIGGLTLATVITLVLVPVLYAIFVLDLKLVRWGAAPDAPSAADTSLEVAARAQPAPGASAETSSSIGGDGAVDTGTLGRMV